MSAVSTTGYTSWSLRIKKFESRFNFRKFDTTINRSKKVRKHNCHDNISGLSFFPINDDGDKTKPESKKEEEEQQRVNVEDDSRSFQSTQSDLFHKHVFSTTESLDANQRFLQNRKKLPRCEENSEATSNSKEIEELFASLNNLRQELSELEKLDLNIHGKLRHINNSFIQLVDKNCKKDEYQEESLTMDSLLIMNKTKTGEGHNGSTFQRRKVSYPATKHNRFHHHLHGAGRQNTSPKRSEMSKTESLKRIPLFDIRPRAKSCHTMTTLNRNPGNLLFSMSTSNSESENYDKGSNFDQDSFVYSDGPESLPADWTAENEKTKKQGGIQRWKIQHIKQNSIDSGIHGGADDFIESSDVLL